MHPLLQLAKANPGRAALVSLGAVPLAFLAWPLVLGFLVVSSPLWIPALAFVGVSAFAAG